MLEKDEGSSKRERPDTKWTDSLKKATGLTLQGLRRTVAEDHSLVTMAHQNNNSNYRLLQRKQCFLKSAHLEILVGMKRFAVRAQMRNIPAGRVLFVFSGAVLTIKETRCFLKNHLSSAVETATKNTNKIVQF